MKRQAFRTVLLAVVIVSMFTSCEEDGGLNLFSLSQDKEFGREFDQEIMNNDSAYTILNEENYPQAYAHIRSIRNKLLASDDLNYSNEFQWRVRIIRDDDVLNAFCVPGGYMYYYTGLIKYLDNEAQLAGVMAHEMAHADKRHVTRRMTKLYGLQFLTGLLLGEDPEAWGEIAAELALGLGNLQFSRSDEYQADEYAVRYSTDTEYHPKGVAGFFEKLHDEETRPKVPEFLSTHPSPDNRLEAIDKVWKEMGSPQGGEFTERYQEFKSNLPSNQQK